MMKQLSLIEKAFFLKKTYLFNNLDLDLLAAIADKMNQDEYDAKEKIFEIDQIANRMYFIIEGTVQLVDSNENLLEQKSKKEFFGAESLFSENPRHYHAICETNCILLTLTKANLLTIISECPSVAIALLQHHLKNRDNQPGNYDYTL